MSNKVYFSDQEHHSIRWYITRAMSTFFAFLLPEPSRKFARKMLLTPVRRPRKTEIPQGAVREKIQTRLGGIQTYQLGSGPVVLMLHGWSGSAEQFFGLMPYVAQMGYMAISYDQPAHGESDCQQTNLPSFIWVLQDILTELDKRNQSPVLLVTHSMGGITAVNVLDGNLPLLMIAPPFDFQKQMMDRIYGSGLHPIMMERVIAEVEDKFDMVFKDAETALHLEKFKKPIRIVHDEDDQFTFHAGSKKAAEEHENVQLLSTKGQGHSRIINSEFVKAELRLLLESL